MTKQFLKRAGISYAQGLLLRERLYSGDAWPHRGSDWSLSRDNRSRDCRERQSAKPEELLLPLQWLLIMPKVIVEEYFPGRE